ncbi:MAG: translation initiation factor IF-2 [Amoebophilaceae bacterium]|nr:translation initiation factor IF-2 [Amoebophilaceae bacterium]
MNKEKNMRLSQVARKLNVATDTIVSFLAKKGYVIDNNPNSKINIQQFELLAAEFTSSGVDKQEAAHVTIGKTYASLFAPVSGNEIEDTSVDPVKEKSNLAVEVEEPPVPDQNLSKSKSYIDYPSDVPDLPGLKTVGKVNLTAKKVIVKAKPVVDKPAEVASLVEDKLPVRLSPPANEPVVPAKPEDKAIAPEETVAKDNKIAFDHLADLKKLTVVGKVILPDYSSNRSSKDTTPKKYDLLAPSLRKPNAPVTPSKTGVVKKSNEKNTGSNYVGRFNKKNRPVRPVGLLTGKDKHPNKKVVENKEGISPQEIERQIKQTLVKLNQDNEAGRDSTRAKYKKDRRKANLEAEDKRKEEEKVASKVLKITEFISANELASFMGVPVNEVLSACISMGMIVSINQRLDAETITVVADEFGYDVAFVDVHDGEPVEETDYSGDQVERPPIVTIMGHVDHGKTSLLDYIRTTKVTAKEAGGITQHIGAYDIVTDSGKTVVFLDTPGHEAFTAMRTRGAKVTDIIIIVVAADDGVMVQTKEAISHAQVAGCPIIIAINKIDKPQANPEKVKEALANQNILVEDWGGKYQCQEISAKTGQGVNDLLEKILLEASLLELKAVPARQAKGVVIDSLLDAGRGYISTVMVQDGTLRVGDIVLAGIYYGKVKAMLNHQGLARDNALPATPVQLLGLNGAPRAGDAFRVMSSIKEATDLAQKKHQLLREQTLRTKSHLTLDEIGRRLAVGNFQQLNLIIKGDVDGSIEALADSLLKLSHEEVQINILHKCVGAVSESDVLLASASASDAMIISFHIKLPAQVKKLAEREGVLIKQYAIIYDAIDGIREVLQGLLVPIIEEVPTGRAEVKKVFPISKVGNIAGCQVQTGFIKFLNPIHVIRKEEIVFTGFIRTIKHGLEEVKQVKSISECGIHIKNFDAIEVGDIIAGFEKKEIQRKL